MKTFKITTGCDDEPEYKAVHYIDCNTIEHISAFAVKIEDQFTIVFMDAINKIEIYKDVK